MASGVNFWAAGNKTVKSASSPTPNITEAPLKPKSDTMLQQKKGLVLKPMKNGTTNGTTNGDFNELSKNGPAANGRKTDWADEEEEDGEFLTQFIKDPRIATLETTIVLKDERVKELEATVVTKTLRIVELESSVQDKHHRISDLEASSEDQYVHLEKLEEENKEKFLQMQELLRDIAKKDECIDVLRYELMQKNAMIHDLEPKAGLGAPSSTNNGEEVVVVEQTKVDTPIATESPDTEAVEIKEKTKVEKATSDTDISDSFEIVEAAQSEEHTKETVEIAAKKEMPSAEIVRDRSLGVSDSPNFYVTKNTLKAVPPAPKPKTLTFPIDFSKYAKKPAVSTASSPAIQQPQLSSPVSIKSGHTTPWGRSAKQARVKTDTKPTFNPSADIRKMPLSERVNFANGPDVVVKLGEINLRTIPKYVLMQCSGKAFQYFSTNPDATSWVFPAGSMDTDAAKVCLTWMDEMTFQGRVYSINISAVPGHDKKNLRICHAARIMGLNNTYVGHFTKQFCDRIRNYEVSYEFMDMVCDLAHPENDPIFECLSNNLVNQTKVGAVNNMAGLEKLVAKHAVLKAKMEQIGKKMEGRMRKTGNSAESSQRGGSKERNGGFHGVSVKKGGHGGGAASGSKPVAPPNGGVLFSMTR